MDIKFPKFKRATYSSAGLVLSCPSRASSARFEGLGTRLSSVVWLSSANPVHLLKRTQKGNTDKKMAN